MKKILLPLALAMFVLLAGCVVTSVYPFFHQKDLAFDPALVGAWTNSEAPGEFWKFEPADTNAYELTIVSSSETNVMRACRFALDREFFLDVVTAQDMNGIQPWPIPSHLLLRISTTNDALKMGSLDYDWLAQSLSNNPAAVRHYVAGGPKEGQRIILTADTSELQKFVRLNLNNTNAWREAVQLQRVSPK